MLESYLQHVKPLKCNENLEMKTNERKENLTVFPFVQSISINKLSRKGIHEK